MRTSFLTSRRWLTLAVVATALTLGACATKGTLPVADLAAARASITEAESAGAAQSAPVELLAAREKLVRATAAGRDENFLQARLLAESATADAQLAERKTRAAKAQDVAMELGRANAVLEREILNRKGAQ